MASAGDQQLSVALNEAVQLPVPRGEMPGCRQVKERKLSLRLKLEDSRDGLAATVSDRDDASKMTGSPSILKVRPAASC
jgi:hypothetical protein